MVTLAKIVTAAAIVTVILLVVQAYAKPAWIESPKAGGPPLWVDQIASKARKPAWANPNATLYARTARLTIAGDRIAVDLTVDVLTLNATLPYGKVVYGSGDVVINGVRYTVKSIEGKVGRDFAKLEIYSGRELVKIRYYDGNYVVEIRTLGKPGFEKYGGTATYTIS